MAKDIYDVEVVIFSQPVTSAEKWPPYPGMPELGDAGPMLGKGVKPGRTARLSGIKKRLEGTPGYQVLRYLKWRQKLPNNVVGKPFKLPETAQEGARLSGTIALGRSIFAKLKVDLLLQENGTSYRMVSRRRMQRNEIHYLDHPKLGVLATITKIQ